MNQVAESEINIWGQRLISLMLILLGVSFAGILILGSYYDQPITQALSFKVSDMERFDSGLGAHSFGDFQDNRYALPTSDYPDIWTNSDLAHPPTALIPNYLAKLIQLRFGVQVALYCFLIALATCTAIPAIFASRQMRKPIDSLLTLLLLSIFTQPLIMTFDRGNTVGFAVPFLLLFAFGIRDDRANLTVVGLVGAFALRPQYALIGIALIALRRFRTAVISSVSAAVIFFGSFLFLPGTYAENFESWRENLVNYSDYSGRGSVFPVNISLSTAFDYLLYIQSYYTLVLVLTATCLVIFFFFRSKKTYTLLLIVSLTLSALIPKTSFAYYSTFVLVIAALIISDRNFLVDESHAKSRFSYAKFYNYLLIVVVAISLAPIPFVREVGRNSIALESFSTMWAIVLIATLVYQVLDFRRERAAT